MSANPILAHQWGVSKAEDCVWAEISGRAPSANPWKRWFVVYQTYLDDSSSDQGVHVLAGYVARAESWAAFAKDWEQILPRAYIGKSGKRRFKMSEMARGHMNDVPLLYNVISEHVTCSVSMVIRSDDLERAKN